MITKKPLLTLLLFLTAFNFSWSQDSNSNSNSTFNPAIDSLDTARMPPPPQFALLTFGFDAAGNQIRRSFCNNSIECDFSRQTIENIKETEDIELIEENVSKILIYPNPTSGIFTLNSNSKVITSFGIYTINGAIIQDVIDVKGFENRQIDISNSPSGVYFLHIHFSDDTNTTKKLIKK